MMGSIEMDRRMATPVFRYRLDTGLVLVSFIAGCLLGATIALAVMS